MSQSLLKNKRSSRSSKISQKSRNIIARSLSDGQSYAGQSKFRVTLPGVPQIITTTAATGVNSTAFQIAFGDILGFATRFGSTFDEYRILGANVRVQATAVSTGLTKFFFDEKTTSAPTANESQERVGVLLDNNSSNSKSSTMMRWRARDLLDLQYTAIASSVTPCTFKIYTDAVNWAAPVSATNLFIVTIDIMFEFRGLKST